MAHQEKKSPTIFLHNFFDVYTALRQCARYESAEQVVVILGAGSREVVGDTSPYIVGETLLLPVGAGNILQLSEGVVVRIRDTRDKGTRVVRRVYA